MATDNLLLGTARKSVGDLTFYVRNGKQVARVRRRQISNPKTQSQASRRATFAPAAKFYSPLAAVLEQSFEGLSKSESYTAFLKQAVQDCAANGWWVSKDEGFFPMPFMVSRGTLKPIAYSMAESEGTFYISNTTDESFGDLDTSTIGGLSQVFTKLGYSEGQQVTFVMIKWVEGVGYYPEYYRIIIEEASTLPSPLVSFGMTWDDENGITLISNDANQIAAGFLIISSYENGKWRRSTQRVSVNEETLASIMSAEAKDAAEQSYMQQSSEVSSTVYLNGSTGYGDSGFVESIALDNGEAFTPRSISYDNGYALVSGKKGSGAITWATVKIGNDYLLTASTKGQLPSGANPGPRWLDGTNAAVRQWLQSQGVSPSVF